MLFLRSLSSHVLPKTKPFYITTPIFYPNANPHIGHLYSLVSADVFARYQRLRGRDVRFLAGTDEHGMKIQKAARKHFGEGGREKEFCDSLSERFRDLARRANISNTMFLRTTSPEHYRAVEHVWRQLNAKGYIYKGNYSGWYSITDECFYTDSQVVAVPPTTTTTTTTPLVSDPQPHSEPEPQTYISLETGAAVEWSSEENYMFRLSAFRDVLLTHFRSRTDTVYPPQYRDQVLGFLGAGEGHSGGGGEILKGIGGGDDFVLADISISRPRTRLEWGVQVPDDPAQTVYVWFDALLIYLTGAGYPWGSLSSSSPETALWPWPADMQVIGKDILRFHAIYLPAILLALDAPAYSASIPQIQIPAQTPTPPRTQAFAQDEVSQTTPHPSPQPTPQPTPIPIAHTLLAHAHWTSAQKKMSKSLGNVADPLEAMERWGVDVVRFYLLRVGGGGGRMSVNWSAEQLDKHHKEIRDQLGNYFLRITSPRIAERASQAAGAGDGEVVEGRDPNYELLKATLALPAKVVAHMETYEAGLALGEIMGVLKVANKTLTDIAPWASSTPPALVRTTRVVALETLSVVGESLMPFMPGVAGRLLDSLGSAGDGDGLSTPGYLKAVEMQLPVREDKDGAQRGKKEMEAFWTRWNGRDVKGVKLF
ncbi:hypothetical protein BDZ97DRAFT_1667313 [Flammula alnicola]|nr:hypothetical protein BDZ97DRAFT_1667313 [Flammula alnicola]